MLGVPKVDYLDEMPRVSADWLALRESADAAARAADLVAVIQGRLAHPVIHDLGCGTGSMGRWLAPQLPGPQHWILYDRDPELLERAAEAMSDTAADGAPVTVSTRSYDVARLTADDLRGAGLVTASALFDLLTAEETESIVTACVDAGCPALLTLSVSGRVELTPGDPLDATVAAAFDAHQRRAVAGRRLLGPDATQSIVEAFARRGVRAVVRSSPWRLGGHNAELTLEWFHGWLAAAGEQCPELAGPLAAYADRRRAELADGRLRVVVGHDDILAGVAA